MLPRAPHAHTSAAILRCGGAIADVLRALGNLPPASRGGDNDEARSGLERIDLAVALNINTPVISPFPPAIECFVATVPGR